MTARATTLDGRQEELLVPYGMTSDDIEVRPPDALRGMAYACPACRGELILKAGAIVTRHFAHKSPPELCDFWHESEDHLRAKQLIAAAINGRADVWFVRRCSSCGFDFDVRLPAGVARATLEYTLPGGMRADVALLAHDGTVRAVLEVCATHACEPEKVAALGDLPWAEFDASALLVAGLRWRALRDHFRPYRCTRCKATTRRVFTSSSQWTRVMCPLPGAGEVLAVETCASCEFFAGVEGHAILCAGGRP